MYLRLTQGLAIALLAAACSGGDSKAVDAAVAYDSSIPDAAVDATPQLSVTAIFPDEGLMSGGIEVLISGAGFEATGGGTPTVTFGGEACINVNVVNDLTLQCTNPPGPFGDAEVLVENAYDSATITFKYNGIFAADGKTGASGNFYVIDPSSGQSTIIGPVGFAITGLALSPDGTIYGSQSTQSGNRGNANLISIDPATGAGTVVGPMLDSSTAINHNSVADIAFVGNRLLGWSETGDDPVEIDPATGAITVIGDSGISSSGSGMAVTEGGTVYFAPGRVNANLFTIDPLTGVGIEGPALTGGTYDNINSMTMLDGVLYAVDTQDLGSTGSQQVLVTIDPATGVMTPIGHIPTGIDSILGTVR